MGPRLSHSTLKGTSAEVEAKMRAVYGGPFTGFKPPAKPAAGLAKL